MPLPPSGADTAWPPLALAPITSAYATWDAWYTGDPAGLRRAYAGDVAPATRPSQRRGGANSPTFASGDVIDFACAMVTKGSALYPFADGSSRGWKWDGTTGGSTSVGYPAAA